MQIDPVSGLRYQQNYCDGGHDVPRGRGPGISERFYVPEGLHRLSIYYANDARFYEPNRGHTLYVQAEQDGCAACPIRYTVSGVYYQFAVLGPTAVTLVIDRNLSVNAVPSAIFVDPIILGDLDKPLTVADGAVLQEAVAEARKLLEATPPTAASPEQASRCWHAARLLGNEPSRTEAYLRKSLEPMAPGQRADWLRKVAERHMTEGLWETGQLAANLLVEADPSAETALFAAGLCAGRIEAAAYVHTGGPGTRFMPLLPAGEAFFETYLDLAMDGLAPEDAAASLANIARGNLTPERWYYGWLAARRLERLERLDLLTAAEVAQLTRLSARPADDARMVRRRLLSDVAPEERDELNRRLAEEKRLIDTRRR